ncbi:MAG: hypothetical protein KGY76_07235, partial [Candidatus Thermoplasmatota archaeon]|nr:hypothetical protein [Candidatus Thermoplasmatota archaeon]
MSIKKSMSLWVIILLVVSVFGAAIGSTGSVAETSADDSRSVTFAGGSGTKDDPYMITNVTQLQNMTANVTAHYELANDIDASNTTDWNASAGFNPVGTSSNSFTGSFDGQNYTITDLYINRSDKNDGGLFGYINDGAEVSNVGLVDVNITGSNNVGGLVGSLGYNGAKVNNSYATGAVNGSSNVGGLVGTNAGIVNHSYATGNVSGDGTIGGLVGRNGYDGTVNNSYATGDVNGTNWDVGGLVGYNEGTVNYSYATGNVSGDSSVGGLVGNTGYFTTISHSYATGNVSGNSNVGGLLGMSYEGSVSISYAIGNVSGNKSVGGLVGRNEYGTVSNSYAAGTVNGTEDVGGLVGNNTEGLVTSSFYHEGMPQSDVARSECLPLSDAEFNSISTFESAGWDIEMLNTDRDKPFLSWEEDEENPTWFIQETEKTYNLTIQIQGGGSTEPSEGTQVYSENGKIVIGAIPEEGWYFGEWTGNETGTNKTMVITMDEDKNITAVFEEYPREIYDWYDLDSVRNDLDGGYSLMNDLDENTDGYGELVDTEEGWDPIGNQDDQFTGTFDGQGYKIKGLYINRSDENYVGLYGVSEGKIENVDFVDANITANEYVGVVAGRNDGYVLNSSATGDVVIDCFSDVGVLVGENRGTVNNSYATGNVSGAKYEMGGLVGYNYGGTVSNSYATGNVSGNDMGNDMVGGLVGESNGGTISNSYATGNVSGTDDVGGLVGYSSDSTIYGSYATGNVSGDSLVGGLVGLNQEGSVNNSYATGEVSGNKYVGGLVGENEEYDDDSTVSNSYAIGNVSGN